MKGKQYRLNNFLNTLFRFIKFIKEILVSTFFIWIVLSFVVAILTTAILGLTVFIDDKLYLWTAVLSFLIAMISVLKESEI